MPFPESPTQPPLSSCPQVFILRIWQEDMGNGQTFWRASVKHNLTGDVRYFQNWQMLAEYLCEKLGRSPDIPPFGVDHETLP